MEEEEDFTFGWTVSIDGQQEACVNQGEVTGQRVLGTLYITINLQYGDAT